VCRRSWKRIAGSPARWSGAAKCRRTAHALSGAPKGPANTQSPATQRSPATSRAAAWVACCRLRAATAVGAEDVNPFETDGVGEVCA
jgi:hypothetical protein